MYKAAIWTVGALLAVLLLALVYTLGYVSNSNGTGARAQTTSGATGDVNFGTLSQIVNILQKEYFGREKLDDRELYDAAIRGMLGSLSDTGTFYIDPTTFQEHPDESGTFEGIGATVSSQNNQIVIIAPIAGSPAERAGIKAGDVILAVDGKSTQGWSVQQAVLEIRGPKGTKVTITVKHPNGSKDDYAITREEVNLDSVTTTPPAGVPLHNADGTPATDLAYMRISEFTERTPQEVENVINGLESSGKKGLIIDLRINPGGLLQETVDTTDMFLDSGTILIEQDRDNNKTYYRAKPGGPATHIPLVLLVDEFSASGAEVLTAALKDNHRATVIGELTYGKGTVNVQQPLNDGGALYVTIRHWLTPDGVQIDEVGITPDIYITPGPLDPDYDPNNDTQLAAAIATLHGQTVPSQPTPVPTPKATP